MSPKSTMSTKIKLEKSLQPCSEDILDAMGNLVKVLKANGIRSVNSIFNHIKREKINTDEVEVLKVFKKSDSTVRPDIKIEVDEIEVIEVVKKGDKLVEAEVIDLEDDTTVKLEKNTNTENVAEADSTNEDDNSSKEKTSITPDKTLNSPKSKLVRKSLKRVHGDADGQGVVEDQGNLRGDSTNEDDDSSKGKTSITPDKTLNSPKSNLVSKSLKRVHGDADGQRVVEGQGNPRGDEGVVASCDENPGPSQTDDDGFIEKSVSRFLSTITSGERTIINSPPKKKKRGILRLNWYPKKRAIPVYLSLEKKKEIVNLVKKYPKWSMAKIQEHTGCPKVINQARIRSWEKQIKLVPNENVLKINQYVQAKIALYRDANKEITDDVLYDLGNTANEKLPVKYSWPAAGPKWLEEFKKENNFTEDEGV